MMVKESIDTQDVQEEQEDQADQANVSYDTMLQGKLGTFLQFINDQNRHKDTMLLMFIISFITFISLYIGRLIIPNFDESGARLTIVSYLTFLLIFIYCYKNVDNIMAIDFEAMCNPDIETPNSLFKVTADNKIYIVFSFVYYYLLIYAKTIFYIILIFLVLYIIYVLLCCQLRYPTTRFDTFLFLFSYLTVEIAGFVLLIIGLIIYAAARHNNVAMFLMVIGGLLVMERVTYWLLGGVNKSLSIHRSWFGLSNLRDFLAPDSLLSFGNITDSQHMIVHVSIFVVGLLFAFIYGIWFLKSSTDLCKNEQDRLYTNAHFMQGLFIVVTICIAMYLVDLVGYTMPISPIFAVVIAVMLFIGYIVRLYHYEK
jgi:hypothetical protein